MADKQQAKRLNGPTTIDIDPDTGRILGDDDTDTSELENDQDKLLDDIIGEFGAGDNEISYSASVTRIPKNFQRGQKEPWLFETDAADIIGIRTKLRDVYRGGQFRIRVYKTTNRGKKLYRQMDYFIEAPEAVSVATGDSKYDAISAALERTQSQLLALADRLSNPLPVGNPNMADPFSMMEKMSVIMKNMMPATAQVQQAPPMSIKDAMDLVTKGMEISADLRGSGEESWISVFKEIAKGIPVGDIMAKLSEGRQPPQMGQRPQLQQHIPQRHNLGPMQDGNRPAPIPPRTNIAPESQSATGQQLEQSMRYLIGRAQKNADPGLYAEWLLDNADKNLIRQMANDPNVLDQLATIFPALHQPLIRAWFGELVDATKELLAQMPENEHIAAGIAQPENNGAVPHGGGGNSAYPGWGLGDQDNPENHAIPGETGAA